MVGEGFTADLDVIEGVARMLRSGSQSMEDLGGSVPVAPDAGEVSVAMASMMSKLAGAAGEVSTGVAAAADEIERSAQIYRESDQAARRNLSHAN
jgi:hypothetical protein